LSRSRIQAMPGNPSQCGGSRFCRRTIGISILFIAAGTWGCGKRTDKLAIDGNVTLDGAPLDLGSIRFSSIGGQKTFASGAMLKDGEYHIPQAKGLPPGTYHVEISSPDLKAPPMIARPAPGEPAAPPTAPERVPAEYNSNSKKTVELAAGKDNRFDFDIKSGHSK